MCPAVGLLDCRLTAPVRAGRKAARNAADAPPAPANSNSFLLGTGKQPGHGRQLHCFRTRCQNLILSAACGITTSLNPIRVPTGLTPVVDSGAADGLQLKFHSRTPNPLKPGTSWKNAPLGPDAEYLLGAIDMYGSNAGLISRKDEKEAGESLSDDSDSDPDDMLEFALHQPDVDIPDEQPPHQARLRLEEQAAYIAELEEQNMTLREKLFLLQEELKEALSHDLSRSATPDYDSLT